MDYLAFYNLTEEPFSQAPNLRFYYNSAQHSRATLRLMNAVDTMKGLAVLLGEIGAGKTILARRMLDSLPEEEYESALLVIIHSQITADWLLTRIARQLGIENPAPEKLKLLNQLYNRLIELHEKKKKAVGLISGGLDSIIALHLMKEQGFEVTGIHILTPFTSGFGEKTIKNLIEEAIQKFGERTEIGRFVRFSIN